MKKDNFIDITMDVEHLDIYPMRMNIRNAIISSLPLFSGKMLDIGCGKMPYKNYILSHSKVTDYTGLDIESALVYDNNIKPDFTWNGINMPFEENSFECAFGTEVLEHCPQPEVILKEVFRVIKPGGVFFFTVPFLWNLHEVPHDEYRYTPFSLERHLANSGFSKIKITGYGGWNASLATMLGLWVRRSGLSERKKNGLGRLIKPIMNYLLKRDRPVTSFKNRQMIPGFYGIAYKP
ncbi:MAG: class I SAM-dependent methyltransferase [Crocinitomicaceae bacterium]|nr:class I SAM-dependent methyltransferase [Crocinitomicaceae bacterium]